MFKNRHFYRGWVIDHDNLGRPYVYNTASPYSEDSDHTLVPASWKLQEICEYIDEHIEWLEKLKRQFTNEELNK